MIVSEEFENNCNELLFGVSGDNSETASTHYLKVEPIIDVVTHDTINFRYILSTFIEHESQNLKYLFTSLTVRGRRRQRRKFMNAICVKSNFI